ncbi:NAD-dependent epimerase/dehydratase family protein, partial [Amycolatopsis sp. NPDC005961]|uniref:NAD-dependent epimerase/dehydratase family protein n=1 Tax=Amycolatopsis sp. NPDC005961 TaxID=3156720 RepID=UPI0033E74B81
MRAGEPDILVTGATGFVGTAVLRELVGRGMGPRVRILARRPPPEWMTIAGVTTWPGDLTDAPGLAGLCTGITTLLHLASQVGGDPARCTAVNEGGTANLLAEAHRAGTRSVLYLSTCAVYQDGTHRGARVPGEEAGGAGSGLAAALGSPPARGAEGVRGPLTSGDWSEGARSGGSGAVADPGLIGGDRSADGGPGVGSGWVADLGSLIGGIGLAGVVLGGG